MDESQSATAGVSSTPPVTVASRAAHGRSARSKLSRSRLGEWTPNDERSDPLTILRRQATTRVPELIPIRNGRMAESPFAYFRGAAAMMAEDLAGMPNSGLEVQLCGDAHLSNFGGFASPERSLVFDVNDFDETLPGPFEWDVKRLATSLEIAARALEFDDRTRKRITTEGVAAYRQAIRSFAEMTFLDIWNANLDINGIIMSLSAELGPAAMKRFDRVVSKAVSKDRLKAKSKLTQVVDGELRFVSDPPLLVPAESLVSANEHSKLLNTIESVLALYTETLPNHLQHLVGSYQMVDLARKVVGVGSVGTRCWVA
ncbi:MAG TPA: DUF2252 family protein, partial [Microthrixaceae bacterium]|nr:DUF2252 family protein [Microthrixaceae bacterium]